MGNTPINANSQNAVEDRRSQTCSKKQLILDIKTSAITDDYYLLTDKELGPCMTARRVIRCKSKETGKNYALKVGESIVLLTRRFVELKLFDFIIDN